MSHDRAARLQTIETLTTILHNLQQYSNDPKFQSLRLSNPRVQRYIVDAPGALHLLQIIGFDDWGDNDDDDHLTYHAPQHDATKRLQCASKFLQQLATRCQVDFVAELAPTPPTWQATTPVLDGGGFAATRGFFLSDDEKWKRAERNAKRRARAGRRPSPGQAPSSRGNWGR